MGLSNFIPTVWSARILAALATALAAYLASRADRRR